MGYFWGRGRVQKLFLSTHIVEQLLFSIVSSTLTFDFGLILGSFFLLFGALKGCFWAAAILSKIMVSLTL